RVRFSPSVEGQVAGLLQLHTDVGADDGAHEVDLTGTGVRSQLAAAFDGLDFGDVEVDTTEVLELPLSNSSEADAAVHFTFSGPDADLFGSGEGNLPLPLPAGETLRVPISFHPSRLGAAQAQV